MNNKTDTPTHTFTPARPQGAALSTAEINQISEKSHIDAFEEDDLFSELQSLWDEQSRRVEKVLAEHPASQPRALNFRRYKPRRRRVMAECLALALLNIAAGLYTLASFLPDPYILIRVTGYVLASTNALMAFHSLYILFSFHRHHPARVATSRMSRFIRRMHMEPHYAPRPDRRRPRVIHVDLTPSAQLHLGKASKLVLRSTFAATRNAVATAFSSARQVAAVSAAAMVVFAFVACTPVGDGHAMSKSDRADRAAAIVNVDEMVAQI